MTHSESLIFTYDGISSEDFGLYRISTDSGLFSEAFLPTRSIIEEKTTVRDEPYFFGFEYETKEIPLHFYFNQGWDDEKVQQVAMWLTQPFYKPLIFDTDPSRIFYCVYTGDPRLLHNGLKQGYCELTMRCNSPYSYTPVYSMDFNIDTLTGQEIELTNIGHMPTFPTITIKKRGIGDISIVNLSNGGIETKITGLDDLETVVIDCANEDIETDVPNVYRYNNFNNKFLKLVTGINRLKITGSGLIRFEYQSKRLI